jgi:hypothetical protein
MFKDRVDNTTDDGHDFENNQVYQNHGIHLALHPTTLAGSAARIENKLGNVMKGNMRGQHDKQARKGDIMKGVMGEGDMKGAISKRSQKLRQKVYILDIVY